MTEPAELILKHHAKIRKNHRLQMILQTLLDRNGMSRVNIARLFDISREVVTRYADQLLEAGLVVEAEAEESARGRRPVLLKVNPALAYTFGIDFGHDTGISAVLLDLGDRVLAREEADLPRSVHWKEKAKLAAELCRRLLARTGISREQIAGTGVSLSGILQLNQGVVVSSSQFIDQFELPLAPLLKGELGVPCHLVNCSHLAAVIEHRWGAATGMRDFLAIGAGLGTGIFANGKLCRGHQFSAGETGYLQLGFSNQTDDDGRYGTLNALVGSSFRRTRERYRQITVNRLRHDSPDGPPIEVLLQFAEEGDPLATQLSTEGFEVLGRALVNLAYIFNPEAILVPSFCKTYPAHTLEVLRRVMSHYGAAHWHLETRVLPAAFDETKYAEGAALLPREGLFADSPDSVFGFTGK